MIVADTWRETERNAVLRRADWRFLLPNSQPTHAVCFVGGALARAVEQVAAIVERDCAAQGTCDLAVAVNPNHDILTMAEASLRPGGVCYIEWTRPVVGGMSSIRQRLTATGFTDIVCYWAWPPPQHALTQFWLPLDSPIALHYFLNSRPRSHGLLQRVRTRLLRAVWRGAVRANFALPLCVMARKPPLDEGRMELHDIILDGWNGWGLGNRPTHLSWLLLTGGQRSINKAVGLVFADNATQPQLAVKWPRVPESRAMLAREAAALRAVQTEHPHGLPGAPRLLFAQDNALGETVHDGTPLYTQLQRENYRDLALKATDWLAQLAGRPLVRPQHEWWDRLVASTLTNFEQSFGDIAGHEFISATRATLERLGDLPIVCEHRDFSPWNVLIGADGALSVLDWESSEPRGLPGIDLVYFLTYLAFFLDGAMETKRYRESYRTARDPYSFTGRVRTECEARYCAYVGLDPAVLQPLRLLTWLIHSRSDYRHILADSAGAPTPEALRGSLFLRLCCEEIQAQHSEHTDISLLE